ncbi:glucose-1-phosphate adenylyltransferase family protein [Candidatus Xianfuyuplasma coldseepsis]|uniref:NTP transferase domain-containing protein n=1 Tax=Candidatus Xianfuyuplasma coldseepsis TaxID=2782163 RepID=A0A7L7KPD9_9MOLU|nr:sugar phosphate nucleotidyltransferase [Xianfuyuplasma coldseepsis]QMS84299.1 NTP transferase domain-containing protein [Xianfuyuplasma coldseepsis]
MKKRVIAMVLVGGRGSRLENITKKTAKPAVAFAGKYKLIDFVLSNLSNSNIDTAGIITQYEPHELMSYIGHGSTWDLDINDGGISFLTPYTSMDGDLWQKGTAHAIKQHFRYIDQYQADYVLILSGDHIYKMNYTQMIEDHIAVDADVTIGAFHASKNASRFGIITATNDGWVTNFEEKPDHPKSNLASMGIYVFKREVLRQLLAENEQENVDFGHDIIPLAIHKNKRIHVYRFNGYFRDVGTINSLFKANMELIDNPQLLKLHEYVDSPVYTKSSNLPPHHIGKQSIIHNTLISDGCLILGDIYHSVLSSSIVVEDGALIRDCIIYEHVHIGTGSVLKNVIILDHTRIPPYTRIECDKVKVIDEDYLKQEGYQHE